MKKINILSAGSAGLLAAAALAFLAPSGHAGTVAYSTGDLVLGFEDPGNANDYVVDLGSASYFISLASSPGTTNITANDPAYGVSLGNIAADLSATYGSTWYANNATQGTNVQWGVFGETANLGTSISGVPIDTAFLTVGENTPGSGSIAPTEFSSTTQNGWNTKFGIFSNPGAGFNNGTATSNSAYATVESDSTYGGAWSNNSPSTNAFTIGFGIEQPTEGTYTGPTNSELDLYELIPTNKGGTGTGVLLGDFTLNSSGALSFTSAAVPEPSTYAAIGLGAAFLLFFRRSRKTLHA